MTMPSANTRRAYALALLAAALIAMSLFAVWPHAQATWLSDKLSTIRGNLSGYDINMAEGEDLAVRNNALAYSNQQSALLLPGATMGTAGAYLQKLILNHVDENGGEVSQVHVLPIIEKNDLIAVPVILNFTTNTKGLRDILIDLESDEPLMFIEELVINPAPKTRTISSRTAQRNARLSLTVSMKIIGYMPKTGARL